MAVSRFPRNLGDDVITQHDIIDAEDGNAYAMIKLPPDENLLHNEVFQGQYISGAGEVTNADEVNGCGVFKSAYVNALKHVRAKRFTCHLQGCPKCFRVWARRQATSAAGYLWAFTTQYNKRLAHWVLSPSDEWCEGKTAKAVWKQLDDKLRDAIDTFSQMRDEVVCVVRHPSRKRCPTCHSKMKDSSSFCVPCNQPAEWFWSPHLHVITSFRFDRTDTSEFVNWEHDNQMIFSEKSYPKDKDNLENVISYELGHALMEVGKQRQAIRYLGLSAKTHFRSEVNKTKEEVGEPNPLDPNQNLVFYKVQPQMVDEVSPGVIRIQRYQGKIPFELDIYNQRIPLYRTRYDVTLTSLGTWLNGRWVRTACARKLPKEKSSQVWNTIDFQKNFLNI